MRRTIVWGIRTFRVGRIVASFDSLGSIGVKAKGAQPELLKEINRAHLFEILRRERTVSRPRIAELTGLSRATVTVLIESLLETGIVREAGIGASSGGRPPVLLQFQPGAVFALGARMHDYEWNVLLTDLDGVPHDREEARIAGTSPDAAVAAIAQAVDRLVARNSTRRILPAMGVGSPGLVDMRSGVIKSATDVGWFEVPLRDMLQSRLGLHVYLANRSKVGALGEHWSGAGAGTQDMIYISIGTGVAAGIIHAGELYIGANSSAGELGHVTVLPDGPFCPCGNQGCLQQLVSDPALAALARRRLRTADHGLLHEEYAGKPESLDAAAVFSAAERGDEMAVELLEETAGHLAVAVGNLINLFNPEMIVLGGHFGSAGELFADMLRQRIRTRAMAHPLSAVTIATGKLGPDAAAIGAAVLVLQHVPELLFGQTNGFGQTNDE
ncbi:MAG: ROK family protein [Spirochaetota bacterium]